MNNITKEKESLNCHSKETHQKLGSNHRSTRFKADLIDVRLQIQFVDGHFACALPHLNTNIRKHRQTTDSNQSDNQSFKIKELRNISFLSSIVSTAKVEQNSLNSQPSSERWPRFRLPNSVVPGPPRRRLRLSCPDASVNPKKRI